jgi:hypothetical protein
MLVLESQLASGEGGHWAMLILLIVIIVLLLAPYVRRP